MRKLSLNFLVIFVAFFALLTMMPAFASDYTLGIFGNANMDDTIDEKDVTYVEGVIKGSNAATNLSDANYDGKIDAQDIDQIEKIIRGDEKEITIVDDTVADDFPNGKPVMIRLPVMGIIALHSNSAEILTLLGSKDNVVGIDKYIANETKFFPEISKLTVVGSMSDPDTEKILQLKPDMIIAYGSDFTKWSIDLEKKLIDSNISLIRLDCYKPETMSKDIIKLGYILNKKDKAKEFIDWYEESLSIINDRVEKLTENEMPRVYVEGYTNYNTYSKGTGAHQACIMAGGNNIAADLPSSYPKLDPEWVMTQNPDIILKVVSSTRVSGGYEEDDPSQMKATWDEIVNRPELKNVKAVRDKKVYLIHTGGVWNDPKYFVGLIYLGKWFHPDLFKDLDQQATHQEYLTRFQGLDYDLDRHGVFVYPPLEES